MSRPAGLPLDLPRIEHAWVDRDSVNGLLAEYGFDHDLDYLGIDLDGVDFWIWEALQVRPRMVICEYNPFFGPDASVTIPYVPGFVRKARDESGNFIHPKGYYGASLRALRQLGQRKGYRLVATAPGSENAYFLRDDVGDRLTQMSAEAAWRPRTKGKKATPYRPELLEASKRRPYCFYEKRGAHLTAMLEVAGALRSDQDDAVSCSSRACSTGCAGRSASFSASSYSGPHASAIRARSASVRTCLCRFKGDLMMPCLAWL